MAPEEEEEELNCENLYGLEEDELDTIEKAAKKLNDEFIDKRISHSGVWTKPQKKGAAATKTKVIFKNYGTKIIDENMKVRTDNFSLTFSGNSTYQARDISHIKIQASID